MKLKDTFMTTVLGEDNVMVEVGGDNFSGIVRSNETAAFILECLKKNTTIEKIVEAMSKEYNAPKEVIEKDVEQIISKLRSINAIED